MPSKRQQQVKEILCELGRVGVVPEKLLGLLTSVCDRVGTGFLQSTAGFWHLLRASKYFTGGNECGSGPNSTNGISTQGCHPGSGACLQQGSPQWPF